MSTPQRSAAAGLAYALVAYVTWGLFPAYFRLLAGVPPLEILAHRVLWAVVVLAALLTALGRWGEVGPLLAAPRRLLGVLATALLISANWLVFLWAVAAGRVMESSLGYFMTPLVSVLLAVVVLGERLSRLQQAAVGLAAAGVLSLAFGGAGFPWVSVLLALTFGGYGLLRKRFAIPAVGGLLVETLVLAPAAAAYLAALGAAGGARFGTSPRISLLLAGSGLLTALPLIWFAAAMQRLRLSTVGLMLYVNPTMQFLTAVLLFGERFTRTHAVAFGCIWISLAVYSADAVAAARRAESR